MAPTGQLLKDLGNSQTVGEKAGDAALSLIDHPSHVEDPLKWDAFEASLTCLRGRGFVRVWELEQTGSLRALLTPGLINLRFESS